MDLTKFLDLLLTEELFFSNVGRLKDKFEGTYAYVNRYGPEVRKTGKPTVSVGSSPHKEFTLVNCWSMSEEESYGLWKVYLGGAKDGVAIRTRVSRIESALSKHNVQIGGVSYSRNPFEIKESSPTKEEVIFLKSPYYRYEEEVRIAIFDQYKKIPHEDEDGYESYEYAPLYPNGKRVKVDIDLLIDEVYVSPFSNVHFSRHFQRIVNAIRPNNKFTFKSSGISES